MQFSIYQESRRGARKSNQDRVAYCYSRNALLLLLTDGMGGHLHGEMAAEIAVQSITEAFRREARPRLPDPRSFLQQALSAAHRAIIRNAEERGLAETPRTTCVACVVQDSTARWAHAGDSRLYHIRDGAILAQTKDHSLVQELVDRGRVREEAIAAHPQRNQIFNCLGSARPPRLDLSEAAPLRAGDTLMLCSDGLWGPLSGNIISSAVLKVGIMQAVPGLLDDAERRAGRQCDNLSAVAVTWQEHPAAARPEQVPADEGPMDSVTTLPRQPGSAETHDEYLSDDEFEHAIARIQSAIEKQTNDKT
jgi:serine/threonine protein phosphatase PrpC